jgi:hypothetical protein
MNPDVLYTRIHGGQLSVQQSLEFPETGHAKAAKSTNIYVRCSSEQLSYSWGWDSSVGIATRYGLDGPEIESVLGAIFSASSRPPLGPIQPPIPGHFRSQNGRGVAFTTHPI